MKVSKRKRIAYWTAWSISMSYFFVWILHFIFGKKWMDRRLHKLHQRSAARIKRVVLELKGLFIKVGQLISILSNVLPDTFRGPLESLQNKIPPRPFAETAETIKQELGKGHDELFTEFDKNPLAAASIGQVYRAFSGGQNVVVKVQHSDIEDIAEADLEITRNLVRITERIFDIKGMQHLYGQLQQMLEDELDYRREAAAMARITKNLANETQIRIPRVHEEFLSKKILVTEFCEGVPISDVNQLDAWGIDRVELAERLLRLFSKMILIDGFYHADPHPGNILVNKDGEIVLLDFGAVAELSPEMRKGFPKIIEAIIRNDADATVKVMREMGFVGPGADAERFAKRLFEAVSNFIQQEVKMDSLNLEDIEINLNSDAFFRLWKELNIKELTRTIQVPKDWILLNRALVLLIGISNQLAPGLNPLQVVRPYIKEYLLEQQGGFSSILINTIKGQLSTVLTMPAELSRFLKKANQGELEMEMKGVEKGLQGISRQIGQLVLAVLCIAAFTFAYLYMDINERYSSYFNLSGVALAILLVRNCWRK